jgi:hypothetical protein
MYKSPFASTLLESRTEEEATAVMPGGQIEPLIRGDEA